MSHLGLYPLSKLTPYPKNSFEDKVCVTRLQELQGFEDRMTVQEESQGDNQ